MYTYLLAREQPLETMKRLYNLQMVYYGLAAVVCAPVGLGTLLCFIAFQQADSVSTLTLTQNGLEFSAATLLPFLPMVMMTFCLLDYRKYEVKEADVEFRPDYHFGPSQGSY